MSFFLLPGSHTLLKRPSRDLYPYDHTLLKKVRHLSIFPGTHKLLSILPPPQGILLLPGSHTFFPGHIKYLWQERFALDIRGRINNNGWKKGGKTVVWQFNAEKGDFMTYVRDYSTCILTPEYQEYKNMLIEAAIEWNLLPEGEKEKYRQRAKRKQLYGYNIFVKEYFKSHKV